MIIKKLQMKNIRSYESFEIDFPEGATLLSGDIGAGKTSILLGLQFALFGLQPGQKGSSILRQGEDIAAAKLELEIAGKEIVIERSLKKSKSGGITQDYSRIVVDNKEQELSTSEMKNKVISLLDYPKEFAKKADLLYKFTVYTPQEGMKEIIQEKPETRLDILRHIFGIDRYKRIKENSQILLQKVKENIKIKDIQCQEINLLRESLTNKKEEKIKKSKEVSNLSIEVTKIEKEKSKAKEQLQGIQKNIEDKQKLANDLQKKEVEMQGKKIFKIKIEKEIYSSQSQLLQKVDFSQERLDSTINLIQKHKKILEEMQTKYLDLNSKISIINSKKDQAYTMKQSVVSLENCPTCFQTVSSEHKEKITKRTQFEIEDLDRELEPKVKEKTQLIKDLEREKELLQAYEQDRGKLEQDKIKSEHQKTIDTKIKSESFVLDRTRTEAETIEKEIKTLQEQLVDFEELRKNLERHQNHFDTISADLRIREISLAEKKKEIEILEKRLEEIELEIVRKESIKSQRDYLRNLQDWLESSFLPMISLTESNVMAKLRQDFSKLFNEWFSILVPESLAVRLDEDFTPIIQNQDYEIDYGFLSGGERTAVALAYRLALNQIINSVLSEIRTKDLIILDEPTDGFSDAQLDKMRDIFDQLNCKQIILVSHEQKIEGFVDNIKIEKEGTSKISKQ